MAEMAIRARCRRCRGDMYLFEVVDGGTGACPRCGYPLSADWTPELLETAERAELLHRGLVRNLRRLVGLPGNLDVDPASVLRSLLDEVGWEEDLDHEVEMTSAAAAVLERQGERWRQRVGSVGSE